MTAIPNGRCALKAKCQDEKGVASPNRDSVRGADISPGADWRGAEGRDGANNERMLPSITLWRGAGEAAGYVRMRRPST